MANKDNGNHKKLEWPLDALLATMRNARKAKNWGGTSGVRAKEAQGLKAFAPPDPYATPILPDDMLLYPFTKGIDLANDGLGYGEETKVQLCFPNGDLEEKRARRTRTGSRRLPSGRAKVAVEGSQRSHSEFRVRGGKNESSDDEQASNE